MPAMFATLLAIGLTVYEQHPAGPPVCQGNGIHDGIGTDTLHQRLYRKPGKASVGAAAEHHVGRTCIADALFPGLGEYEHMSTRRQHHRGYAVGMHTAFTGGENISDGRIRYFLSRWQCQQERKYCGNGGYWHMKGF
jgi:hypothetical protein